MYHEDHYVVLAPNMTEQFVTPPELAEILCGLLAKIQDRLPPDLQTLPDLNDQAQRLIKTTCELDCDDLGKWQWYVVRLEKAKVKKLGVNQDADLA